MQFLFILLVVGSLGEFAKCESLSAAEELTFTDAQQTGFTKFKTDISPSIVADFMKTDIYLAKVFRACNFDAAQATLRLQDTLKFRIDNKIDGILNEDFSDVSKDLPYTLNRYDKEGRPVIFAIAEKWNLFMQLQSGKEQALARYIYSRCENATTAAITKYGSMPEPKVSRFISIVDMFGFQPMSASCPACLNFFKVFGKTTDQHWVSTVYRFMLINMPEFFASVVEAVKLLIAKETADSVEVFGHDATKWQARLADLLGRENIPTEFHVDNTPMGASGMSAMGAGSMGTGMGATGMPTGGMPTGGMPTGGMPTGGMGF